MCYTPTSNEESVQEYHKTVAKSYLDKFEKFIGNSKFLSGNDHMSHADVFLFDLLDQMLVIIPNLLENHKNLQKFYQTFNEMEEVKSFRKDSKYIDRPLNNPHSKIN